MKEPVFIGLLILSAVAGVSASIILICKTYKYVKESTLVVDLSQAMKWLAGKVKEAHTEKDEISGSRYAFSDLLAAGHMFYFCFALLVVVGFVLLATFLQQTLTPAEWFTRLAFVTACCSIIPYYRVQAGNAWRSFRKR